MLEVKALEPEWEKFFYNPEEVSAALQTFVQKKEYASSPSLSREEFLGRIKSEKEDTNFLWKTKEVYCASPKRNMQAREISFENMAAGAKKWN